MAVLPEKLYAATRVNNLPLLFPLELIPICGKYANERGEIYTVIEGKDERGGLVLGLDVADVTEMKMLREKGKAPTLFRDGGEALRIHILRCEDLEQSIRKTIEKCERIRDGKEDAGDDQ